MNLMVNFINQSLPWRISKLKLKVIPDAQFKLIFILLLAVFA